MSPEQSRRVDVRSTRVAHLEEMAATTEIKPADTEFDEIGQDPVRHLLRPFALHEEFEKDGHRQRQAAAKRSS